MIRVLLVLVGTLIVVVIFGQILEAREFVSALLRDDSSGFDRRSWLSGLRFWELSEPEKASLANMVVLLLGAVLIIGMVGYLATALVSRTRPVSPGEFVRVWWKSCLWGAVLLPLAAFIIGTLPASMTRASLAILSFVCWLVFGPFLVMRVESRSRRSRWRPVCPECGYSLRGQRGGRCAECGERFPTAGRAFRRWAFHRLAWDRASRPFWPTAYIRTVLAILLCPCRAAQRLAVPDRMGRAVRWAVFHLLVLVALFVFLPRRAIRFIDEIELWLRGLRGVVERPTWQTESFGVYLVWTAQSAATWSAFILVTLAIPMGMSVWPINRRPAARLGLVKWTLYATCIPVIAWFASAAGQASFIWFAPGRGRPSGMLLTLLSQSLPLIPIYFVSLSAAVGWSLGAASNPYLFRRGIDGALLNIFVSSVAWLVIWLVLFPPGPIEALAW